MTDGDGNTKPRPDWWDTNQNLRDRYSLPEYNAPRFKEGTYTYEVVSEIEDQYACDVRFIGINTRYPEDWEIRIDGDRVADIARRRDSDGNTVFEMTAEEFREVVEASFEESQNATS
jgi:hypothetical protein